MKKYPYVLIWIGFFFSKVFFAFFAYINSPEDPIFEPTSSLILILFLVSVITVAVVILLSRGLYYRYTSVYKMLEGKIPFHEKGNPESINYSIFIVIGGLNEVPAILGFVLYFQTLSLATYIALTALSLIGWIATKPRKVKMTGNSQS